MTGDPDGRSLRWKLAVDEVDQGSGALFPDESRARRHVGTGEYRGLEFLEVNAHRIINDVPKASHMPFRHTINAYRGCSHACSYCLSGETPVLMADGRTRSIQDLRPGDEIIGTERVGSYRRYVRTSVLDHWSTLKTAYRVSLHDGTELVTSADHRFLTNRGWKHVTGTGAGIGCRPHLTVANEMLGIGRFAVSPKHDDEYRRGYLCGMLRGDATLKSYEYSTPSRPHSVVHRFRLALVDDEGLERARDFLMTSGVETDLTVFSSETDRHRALRAIRTSRRDACDRIREIICWPGDPSSSWQLGFLAGIFDAEGSSSCGVLRISNTDPEILDHTLDALDGLGFDIVLENLHVPNGIASVRIRGGLRERLRFYLTVDPAITRKRTIDGVAIKSDADLRVHSIEELGLEIPMYDITTSTGDFVANGVVSHNCFARPTHAYLGLGIGGDFDSKIVVKVNAVERVGAELRSPRWGGEHIAMGTNTDPYQKAEGRYHLTRGIIEVLGEAGNPFSILTKSTLVLRDLDVLAAAAKRTPVRLNFSIGTLDRPVWRLTEPGTPRPDLRVEAVKRLNDAGVACGVLMGPILPGLSDSTEQLRDVVEACVAAGAVSISAISLHLRPGVREHFLAGLARARPDLTRLYEQRFTGRDGPRSYQPKTTQEELSSRVRRLVRESEGRFEGARRVRLVESVGDLRTRLAEQGLGPEASEPISPAERTEQLRLL